MISGSARGGTYKGCSSSSEAHGVCGFEVEVSISEFEPAGSPVGSEVDFKGEGFHFEANSRILCVYMGGFEGREEELRNLWLPLSHLVV